MIKVKIFGVLRTTIGFGYLELSAKNVAGVFEEISKIMKKRYIEDLEKLEKMKNDPNVKYIKPRNQALEPHEALEFGDAIVYINGERCLRKGKKVSDNDEIWLMSPAAGG